MLARLSATDRFALIQGARDYSPTLMAILSWGLVTGVAMSKSVMTIGQATAMSLLAYAGSSQLAVLPLLAAKLPVWTALLTATMVNLRFVIFSAGLAPHFSYLPLWRRLAIGYFNGDVIYLLFQKQGFATGYVPGKEAYFWGMALASWVSWQVSSIAGILLASFFPASWGLELAGTLALIPIMVSAIANRSTLAAVGIAGVVSLVAFDLPYRLALPLAVLAGPCGVRAAALRTLDQAGRPWREHFTGGGIATVTAAAAAGLAVCPLARRVAPRTLVDVGAKFDLPPLPHSQVVLYTRVRDVRTAAVLQRLADSLAMSA